MTEYQEKLIDSARKGLKGLLGLVTSGEDIEKIIAVDKAYESGMDALDAIEDEFTNKE